MAIIGGNPAIAVRNSTTKQIIYIRANDNNGTVWGTPYAAAIGKAGIALAEINGLPAISHSWDNGGNPGNPNTPTYQLDLRYVRALNVAGSSWSSAVTVATYGQNYTMNQTALLVVAGNPAIFYHLGEPQIPNLAPIRPWFVRANDVNGAGWGAPVNVFPFGTMAGDFAAAVVNGQPALAWHLIEGDLIKLSLSANNGTSFFAVDAFKRGDFSSSFLFSLAQIQGQPALTYSDGGELFYLRDQTSPPDTHINWIAVEP